jgi:trehalose/maltose transport system substrate-binding protein
MCRQMIDPASAARERGGVGRRLALFACIVLCSCGAKQPTRPQTSVVLTTTPLIENETLDAEREYMRTFAHDTGIAVRLIPNRESATDRLDVYQGYFRAHSPEPDVLTLDFVWPGVLVDHLLDLNPWLGDLAKLHFPELIRNSTVHGRLVALPLVSYVGLLYYRSDLLAEYGFRKPPRSWAELERMAGRIQAGERRKGHSAFWGYVWQGDAYEGLTCNAMEWQGIEGGGRIINEDGSIEVNNPVAEEAWERAARWVGSISPPSVVEYKEKDADNVFEVGNAAFLRTWSGWRTADTHTRGRVGATTLPRGGVIGGGGLGISRYSKHPREAAAFIRYFTGNPAELSRVKLANGLPTMPSLQTGPVPSEGAHPADTIQTMPANSFSRPSAVSGTNYDRVSRSYFLAAHSVLKREMTAAQALAALEKELSRIPGLRLPARRSVNPQ